MTTNIYGSNVMAYDSPWEKGGGGREFFFIRKPYDGFLICELWLGSSGNIEKYNSGRAFKTKQEAEKKLGKIFEEHAEAGNYMKEKE